MLFSLSLFLVQALLSLFGFENLRFEGRAIYFLIELHFGLLLVIILPITLAISILRYRLYDIDVIIRRTLQYSALTGVLLAVYLSLILGMQGFVQNLTGDIDSPIIVVFSTLVIAALFNPLRIRIQFLIDRRFYRAKYDTEIALMRFAQTARNEVDMDRLSAALLGVVDETLQPEKIGLWLRDGD